MEFSLVDMAAVVSLEAFLRLWPLNPREKALKRSDIKGTQSQSWRKGYTQSVTGKPAFYQPVSLVVIWYTAHHCES
jgi:hypothetical protein